MQQVQNPGVSERAPGFWRLRFRKNDHFLRPDLFAVDSENLQIVLNSISCMRQYASEIAQIKI